MEEKYLEALRLISKMRPHKGAAAECKDIAYQALGREAKQERAWRKSWQIEGNEDRDIRDWPSHASYKVMDTEVLVGSRPDCYGFKGENSDKIGGFLSVSDRYVDYPINYNTAWYPWNEGIEAPYSVLFPSLITLHRWIIDEKLDRVYIHCCAGTHRAPTIFGAFLWTFFNKEKEEIANGYKNVVRQQWSDPNYYFDDHLRVNPQDKAFFEYMGNKYDFSKDRDHQSMESVLKEIGIEDETRRNKSYFQIFPTRSMALEEMVRKMADACFDNVHWTNTKIGKEYYELFDQILGQKWVCPSIRNKS